MGAPIHSRSILAYLGRNFTERHGAVGAAGSAQAYGMSHEPRGEDGGGGSHIPLLDVPVHSENQ
jgi:hypothetical protein